MDIWNIIANQGVAVFIAIYLIYFITKKLNSKLDRLIESIQVLNNNIEKLIIEIKGYEKN